MSPFLGEKCSAISSQVQYPDQPRLLVGVSEVLIFDEATSALDNATEARLMEAINMVSKERTVIMIAHRLTTLKDCDKIIHMKKGRGKFVKTCDNMKTSKNLSGEYVQA